ncbi:unnamed protein product [Larinioides sclopetarius]|uniref:Protein kinase domain-containing protein n=2 Tax=Larinioides sclopetarius TaxID=280406 RepID=A0AAV2BLZ6_9ARAC
MEDDEFIDGRHFDLWSFGVMGFELLTAFYMSLTFDCCDPEKEARNAFLRKALQEDVFIKRMNIALPKVEITPDDLKLAIKFILSFLKAEPNTRMTADIGLHHKFLQSRDVKKAGSGSLLKLPNATGGVSTSSSGRISNQHQRQSEDSIRSERETNWFSKRCSDLYMVFIRCLPCTK